MGGISRYDYLAMALDLQERNRNQEAIEVLYEARNNYPEEYLFEKHIGDLHFEMGKYEMAMESYLYYLEHTSHNPVHFKHFALFWERMSGRAETSVLDKYAKRIEVNLKIGTYSKKSLVDVCRLIAPYVNEDKLHIYGNDSNFDQIVSYTRELEKSYRIYILFFKLLSSEHSVNNKRIDKFIVSSMEKKELYDCALNLICRVLEYDNDNMAIRTMFRLCRRQKDYSKAQEYIDKNPQIKEWTDSNIQYELIYYFAETGKKEELNKSLNIIEKSGYDSIPILRTLYNFYLQFDMFEQAERISSRLAVLQGTDDYDREKERNELKEELNHSREMLPMSEMLSGFSHELKQPITNIRYSVQSYQMKLKKNPVSTDEINALFDDILSQAMRIKSLLSRFSPLVAERENAARFSVYESITGVFDEFDLQLSEENIQVYMNNKADFNLNGDSIKFDQIFYNLIGNSIYAIKEKGNEGNIWVTIEENAAYHIITFADDGIGINPQYYDKLFEPFFTTKEPKAEEDGGEGLGLYIVRNIIHMFNGDVRIDKTYHNGARFIFEINK